MANSPYQQQILGLEKQRETARKLREHAMTAPESQMVSGWYVPPSWTQYAAQALRGYMAHKDIQSAEEQQKQLEAGRQTDLEDIMKSFGPGGDLTQASPKIMAHALRYGPEAATGIASLQNAMTGAENARMKRQRIENEGKQAQAFMESLFPGQKYQVNTGDDDYFLKVITGDATPPEQPPLNIAALSPALGQPTSDALPEFGGISNPQRIAALSPNVQPSVAQATPQARPAPQFNVQAAEQMGLMPDQIQQIQKLAALNPQLAAQMALAQFKASLKPPAADQEMQRWQAYQGMTPDNQRAFLQLLGRGQKPSLPQISPTGIPYRIDEQGNMHIGVPTQQGVVHFPSMGQPAPMQGSPTGAQAQPAGQPAPVAAMPQPMPQPAPAPSAAVPNPFAKTEKVEPPKTRQLEQGNTTITQEWNPQTQSWKNIAEAPRFKPEKQDKAAEKTEDQKRAQEQFSKQLSTLHGLYGELNRLKAITSETGDIGSNISARLGASDIGQTFGGAMGTKAQSIRDKIAQSRPLLLNLIKNATNMSAQQMNSNAEMQMYLQAATDPKLTYEANISALQNLDNLFGLGMGFGENAPREATPSRGQAAQRPKGVGADWTLKVDAKGNKAWVSPNGKNFVEVK